MIVLLKYTMMTMIYAFVVIMNKINFIIGCARSGTTSLCEILNMADNAVFLNEPNPNLNFDSRKYLDGDLSSHNAKEILKTVLNPRINKAHNDGMVYGEKNVTLSAFTKELSCLYECNIIFVVRDGRDVVQSMFNWHQQLFGNFYRECNHPVPLSIQAQGVVDNRSIEKDTANYSRPRPLPDDPYYDKWDNFTLHQMLCWYWSFINEYVAKTIDDYNSYTINYSSGNLLNRIMSLIDQLELEGISRQTVSEMLGKRINSVHDRTGEAKTLPTWAEWPDLKYDQFWEMCGNTMNAIGISNG